jgi:hypothetical protein
MITNSQKHFVAANNVGFAKNFLPEGYEEGADNLLGSGYRTYYITSIPECISVLQSTVTKVRVIFEVITSKKALTLESRSSMTYILNPPNVTMRVTMLDPSPRTFLANMSANIYVADNAQVDALYFFNERVVGSELVSLDNPLGNIFNGSSSQLRDAFDRLQQIELSFAVKSLDLTIAEAPECVNWYVFISFDNSQRDGRVKMSISTNYGYCVDNIQQIVTSTTSWLAITVLVLASISLINRVISLIRRGRNVLLKRFRERKALLELARQYIDLWMFVALTKDAFAIIGYSMFLDRSSQMEKMDIATSFFTGVGSLFAYVGLIGHLQYYAKFYTLIEAVKNAIPSISRFVIGILPIYIGYSLAGTVWFGHYAPFVSLYYLIT